MAWAQADLIITGGRVYAADLSGRQAEAVAIKGDRVLALGTRQEVAEFRGPATEVVELQGQTVLPGLIDAHCHVIGLGLARAAIDLNYPRARSVADICRLVEERAHSQPPGTWVRGRGYDHLRLQERRHPTR
ncbi:MAG TPA: amidohydrolase family protein, partial [Firmicutes bacterium]|nr:amidohydrolase family protein [Bacillota bacterium]